MNKKKLIPIGVFTKPHGLKGDLKVFLYNDKSQTLVKGIYISIKTKEDFISFKLDNIKGTSKNLILKLSNVDSRTSSEELINKEIYVSRDDFPEIDRGFYLNDIIGFNVIDEKNNSFGSLIDVLDLNGNEVIVIEFNDKEILVPNVDEFVTLFDFKDRKIIVKNIEQFIDEK